MNRLMSVLMAIAAALGANAAWVETPMEYRAGMPDTLMVPPVLTYPIDGMPQPSWRPDGHYDGGRDARVRLLDWFSFKYQSPDTVATVQAIEQYTFGNGQAGATDVIFVGPDAIAVLVCQGWHQIYSAETLRKIGELPGYIYESFDDMIAREQSISHAQSGVADAYGWDGKLYVVSNGGVLRIYDIAKMRLEHVVVLWPEDEADGRLTRPIDQCFLYPQQGWVAYSFDGDPIYYHCNFAIYLR
ncbi:MAG: hypothetical protein LUD17_02165 [Bacteroidales bacterium]|nr:hypothetical protein [Bacteroidales bacterium]